MTDLRAKLSAALAGRYELDREIGAGGMATVFLARDVKHDRKVAMKVVHPKTPDDRHDALVRIAPDGHAGVRGTLLCCFAALLIHPDTIYLERVRPLSAPRGHKPP